VIAAGQPSPEGVGHSQVIAPTGEVLVALGHDAGVAVAELDLQLVTDQRATNPMAQARRLGVHPSA
jgi:predicted amidohydrolase